MFCSSRCVRAALLSMGVWAADGLNSIGTAADPEFLQHTPADRDVVLYVADVLPHLQRVLTSDRFLELATRLLAFDETRGLRPDPAQWLSTVNVQAAPFIPTEVAITMNQKALAQIARLLRIGMQIGLCNGAIKAEQPVDLAKVQQQMLQDLQLFRLTGTDLWLNFRNPAPAAIVLGQVSQLADQWAAAGLVKVARGNDELRVRANLDDFVDPDMLPFYLLGLGIVEDDESPLAVQLSGELADLSLDVRLRKVGNAIQLCLDADSNSKETLSTETLGDGWQTESSTLMLTSYRIEAFRDEVLKLEQTWRDWENSATGQATAALDDDDMLGDLRQIARWLRKGATHGTIRASWKNQMQIVWHEYGVPAAVPLADLPVMHFIPKSPGIVAVTSISSLADQLSEQLADFEDRLATNSLKYEMTGRSARAQMTESMARFYYDNLSRFRTLVKDESFHTFESPAAIITNASGQISSLTASFTVDGGQNRVVGTNLRCPQVAMIGRIKQGGNAGAFVESVWRAFLEGLSEDEVTLNAVIVEADFELGVPTYAFSGDWQKQQLPYNLKLQSTGGLEPHYFSPQPNWFVFSTSPELSRSIVAAIQTPESRWKRPEPADDTDVVAFGDVPGSEIASLIRILPETFRLFLNDSDRIQLTGNAVQVAQAAARADREDMQKLLSILDVVIESCEAMKSVNWTTRQTDFQRTTRAAVEFSGQ